MIKKLCATVPLCIVLVVHSLPNNQWYHDFFSRLHQGNVREFELFLDRTSALQDILNHSHEGHLLLNHMVEQSTATSGSDPYIEVLLQRGINPNMIDERGEAALHVALRKNCLTIVEQLLRYGARVSYQENELHSPLQRVVETHNDAALQVMLPYLPFNKIFFEKRFTDPLINALLSHNFNRVQALLGGGANPNGKNSLGWTALHYAVDDKNSKGVHLLLKYGAAVTGEALFPLHDVPSQTPLGMAVWHGLPAITLDLLLSGARVNGTLGQLRLVDHLLQKCDEDDNHSTCLHLLLIFGGEIDVHRYKERLQRMYQNFDVLQAVALHDIDRLRNLLKISDYASMNTRQKIEHIKTMRDTWGRDHLHAALALAIGQRFEEAVRELVFFAQSLILLAPHTTSETMSDTGQFCPTAINIHPLELMRHLLESTHFSPEHHERYRHIVSVIARAIALQVSLFRKTVRDRKQNLLFHYILSPQPQECDQLIEEACREVWRQKLDISLPTFQLLRSSVSNYFPSDHQNYYESLCYAIKNTNVQAVSDLIHCINPLNILKVEKIAHRYARLYEHTECAERATEIVKIIEGFLAQIQAVLTLDFPVNALPLQ